MTKEGLVDRFNRGNQSCSEIPDDKHESQPVVSTAVGEDEDSLGEVTGDEPYGEDLLQLFTDGEVILYPLETVYAEKQEHALYEVNDADDDG